MIPKALPIILLFLSGTSLYGADPVDATRTKKFWSFVAPRPQAIPATKDGHRNADQPIDRFVTAQMVRQGLQPSPRADKRTLLRRITFDLTGLPPSLDEIHGFLADPSEHAYENLVDRLLAKPQFGEHMARHWLDLVRFADTNGLHHDHYRQLTPYRDWIIRAFNDNLGFDEFVRYQIAGDLFPEPNLNQQIASGFNRLHLIIDQGTALPEESFTRNVVDRVTAVGTAFLGLTVQCAACHDHKYDPMTQRDFYQLFAFFNNFDGNPETNLDYGTDFRRGLQPPYINLQTPAQAARLQEFDAEISTIEKQIGDLAPPEPEAKNKNEQALKTLQEQLKKRQEERAGFEQTIPGTLVMKERAEVRPAHILIRGEYDQPGEQVERNTPAFLPPMKDKQGLKSRMDLAEWLVDASNPLTARVAVNRFWQQLFGVGLVRTSEDFGTQGERPSHPKLLDFLALKFMNSGWDVKKIVRSIVLSETYQQSSKASPERYESDPNNRQLTRGSRFRLDAEMIRDQVLSACGLLDSELYGKSVKPPQPEGLWLTVAMPGSYPRKFQADSGSQIYRRSVYTFWKRALPPPQMTIFDAPMRESCVARRERTNTPLQALLLMNEKQFFYAAMRYAMELLKASPRDDDQEIRRAYERVTSQLPGAPEMESLREALRDFRQLYSHDTGAARAMTTNILPPDSSVEEHVELAAWTLLVHSLLNLDITKTRQ